MSRRRIYLMRHAEVAYFENGRPLNAKHVPLTEAGREQAAAAREALAGIELDRVVTSGLARTLETARIVAPDHEPESWPELRELEGRFGDVPPEELERVYVGAFDGIVSEDTRFLGGETIGSLFDRVLPALERLLADASWDIALVVGHGGVNRAIVSYALTGQRLFLGNLEQAPACINTLDVDGSGWIVRAINHAPYDPTHRRGRQTTMEELWSHFKST